MARALLPGFFEAFAVVVEEREVVHVAEVALRFQNFLAEVVQAVEVDHLEAVTNERVQPRRDVTLPEGWCLFTNVRAPRGLDKDLVLSLADGRWVREHLSILIIGPAGIGKSWIACALAHSACRHGHSASYRRLPRLLTELAIARADGSYPKLLASLAKTEVLVIDDFGLAKLSAENRRDLLEITEDRYGIRSTVITSQLPVENWHDIVGDPTLADAILDRLVHSSYQLNLKGESMRKRRQPLTQTDHRDSYADSCVLDGDSWNT